MYGAAFTVLFSVSTSQTASLPTRASPVALDARRWARALNDLIRQTIRTVMIEMAMVRTIAQQTKSIVILEMLAVDERNKIC